jgi:hypothetical protein
MALSDLVLSFLTLPTKLGQEVLRHSVTCLPLR